jgi:hypothetical protein
VNMNKTLLGAITIATCFGCQKTLDLQLTVVPACDQQDALSGSRFLTVRAEGLAIDTPRESTFSFESGSGQLTQIPPTDGGKISVLATTGDEATPATTAGGIGWLDLTGKSSDAPLAVRVLVGKVGTFATTSEGPKPSSCSEVTAGRQGQSATLLSTGEVLIVGGEQVVTGTRLLLRNTEIYNHETGAFTATADLPEGRAYHSATLLANDRVLICGGQGVLGGRSVSLNTCLLFDSRTRRFIDLSVAMNTGRQQHTATRLGDGRVVLAGGVGTGAEYLLSTEVYDPDIEGLEKLQLGPNLVTARAQHTATLLNDEATILIAGGRDGDAVKGDVELWSISTSKRLATSAPRYAHIAAKVPDGRVVIAGGFNNIVDNGNPIPVGSVEIFDPASGGSIACSETLTLGTLRGNAIGEALPPSADGIARVLIAGGTLADGSATHLAEIVGLTKAKTCASVTITRTAGDMHLVRTRASSVLLPGGDVLMVGGSQSIGAMTVPALRGELFISPR